MGEGWKGEERACSADWYQWRQIELAGDRWSSPAVTPSYGSVHNVFPSFSSRVSSATIQPSRRLFLQRHSFENISRAPPLLPVSHPVYRSLWIYTFAYKPSESENLVIFRLSSLSPLETMISPARFSRTDINPNVTTPLTTVNRRFPSRDVDARKVTSVRFY